MREKQFPHKPNPSGAEEKQKNKLVENLSSLHIHADHHLVSRLRDLVLLARHHQALRQERYGEDTARCFAGD